MRKLLSYITVSALLIASCNKSGERVIAVFETSGFEVGLNNRGEITGFKDIATGKNYLASDTNTFLMSIRIDGVIEHPSNANFIDDIVTLDFNNEIKAAIRVDQKDTHIVFELIDISDKKSVELVIWGPYYTTIGKIIGETVGVVRDEYFAIGIQSLNIKTLGGYPWNESDRMPAFDIFKANNIDDMKPKADGTVLYRVEAAKPTKSGSSIQAYTRNRNKARVISDFNHDRLVAPAYNDGGVVGSSITIFGCESEKALDYLGEIEIAEDLPHPMLNGKWTKKSPEAASAYIITSFTEDNVEKAIDLTKRAGLKYLYHYGKTFENWGHFELFKGEFPVGIEGLRTCVRKAESEGIRMGTHCLSNFITTNDPYVTPVPDNRLAKVGSTIITKSIDDKATEIFINSPDFFNQMKNNNLKTVLIGEELIRYGSVTKQEPWILTDCQRGAFGTRAGDHEVGEEISKLLDHGYKVFLTNADLTIEMSERLADIYNQTGLKQISFDGLEGNRSTGLGTYGESLMPYTWYNSLLDSNKHDLIIDASRTTHFFWHIYTRMNWGEPWYAGFRESQTEYRFNNQAYFKRNFMPGMLGWFKMTPETSVEDIQWLLARSAGYDAGYSLVADLETIEHNGNSDKILELIGDWEKLRLSDSFTETQKELMRENSREFLLEPTGDSMWTLQEVYSGIYFHTKKDRQPGEPLHTQIEFNNKGTDQPLCFIITAIEGDASNISLEINNYRTIELPFEIKAGQIIHYNGSDTITLMDSKWNIISALYVDPKEFAVIKGVNSIAIDCDLKGSGLSGKLNVELKTLGEKQEVALK